jgi:hypothetical protein
MSSHTEIEVVEPKWGSYVEGYMTVTTLPDGELTYCGLFDTIEEAQKWGANMINAKVVPLYQPTFNWG